ncbi:hypothetical protein INR49_006760 [Caranx melampygus]|nr:hypothetical protein INR49_006760 [Caranx melampygus]
MDGLMDICVGAPGLRGCWGETAAATVWEEKDDGSRRPLVWPNQFSACVGSVGAALCSNGITQSGRNVLTLNRSEEIPAWPHKLHLRTICARSLHFTQ